MPQLSPGCLPSSVAPCLPHPIFLVVFFISVKLRNPVLLPGVFGKKQISGVEWVCFGTWAALGGVGAGTVLSSRLGSKQVKEGGSGASWARCPPLLQACQPPQALQGASLDLSLSLWASVTCHGSTRNFQNRCKGGALTWPLEPPAFWGEARLLLQPALHFAEGETEAVDL